MKFYSEPTKQIPVRADVDVLVVGGGPAGFSAAVCAARMGAKTMLIEQTGAVGGVATSGLMSHWTGKTRGGFYEEILNKSSHLQGVASDYSVYDRQIINPEILKNVMLVMLKEAGVDLQLYTLAASPIMDSDTIKGVIIESKSGREAIYAKIVIDASGDGDIAARAGAPFYKGRENDGSMQPMTIMFKLAGVDTSKVRFVGSFEETYDLPEGDLQSLAKKSLPYPSGHVLIYKTTLPGVVTLNMTNCVKVDGTKAEDLTLAEYTCRSQMEPIVNFMRKYLDGFENSYIISSAAIVGVRETRHFNGERTITENDIMQARVFEDWAVTKAHFNFDVHNINGSGLDKSGVQKYFVQETGYTIPYGCFVPLKIENLMLAGRNISGTHMAHSNYRAMPICANIGQSVGMAAALCIQKNVLPRKLDVRDLQHELIMVGVEP